MSLVIPDTELDLTKAESMADQVSRILAKRYNLHEQQVENMVDFRTVNDTPLDPITNLPAAEPIEYDQIICSWYMPLDNGKQLQFALPWAKMKGWGARKCAETAMEAFARHARIKRVN